MINLENAKNIFFAYVNKYDRESIMVERKIAHTLRVMEICKRIATELKLSDQEIDLAILIGLLHDIGRFEQAKLTNSYSELNGIDHAQMGVKILFEYNKIREFLPDDKAYDNIIKVAVEEHNRFKMSEGLHEKEKLFSRIIRDADKLDNMELFIVDNNLKEMAEYSGTNSVSNEITPKVLDDIYNNKSISNEKMKTILDLCMRLIGFIYDINFDVSLRIISENDYINRTIDKIKKLKPSQKYELEKIRNHVNNYLNNNI